jgi:hypothetical protein
MSKKIAIIYTGEVRTIEKAIQYFKENVIINDNYHVFAVLQTNNIEYFDNLVKNNIGDNLKSINWFINGNEEWVNMRESLLNQMSTVGENWKNYLRNSGSMIEYYQMYLAYKNIEEYEKTNNFEYDYIMRIRCDVVLTHPIHFDCESFTMDDVKSLLYEIKEINNFESIISYDVINIFMNAFYHKNRILCKNVNFSNNQFSRQFKNLLITNDENNIDNKESNFIKSVYDYLLTGNYAITFRKNIIYFMRRKLFTNISKLGITYGSEHKMENNDYWFNAESQLDQIFIENDIDVFDSTTNLEHNSLYSYDENVYFENSVLKKTHEFLFFIRRH